MNSKKARAIYFDYLVFGVLVLVYATALFLLFYNQCINGYPSDMKTYVKEVYNWNHSYPIFFYLSRFFAHFVGSAGAGTAISISFLNTLSPLFLKYYMDNTLLGDLPLEYNDENKYILKRLSVSFLTIGLFLVSMLYVPGIKFVASGNYFQNATSISTKPFMIVVFFVFARILDTYEEKVEIRDVVTLAIFTMLSTFAKPSFTFVFIPAAAIILAYRLIKNRFGTLKNTVLVCLAFAPTFLGLVFQFWRIYTESGRGEDVESSIAIGFMKSWIPNFPYLLPLVIFMAIAFPLAVLFFHRKEIKTNTLYRLSWQIYIMATLQKMFIYETGERATHGNFGWGYLHGIFLLFVASVIVLKQSNAKRWQKIALWCLFGLHLVLGIWYFWRVFCGGSI